MAGWGQARSWQFLALSLLWLPCGVVAIWLLRFGPGTGPPNYEPWLVTMATQWPSLVPLVPCGLPLALGCRRLWRLGYRRGAWVAGLGLGAVTVLATLPAGLLGPVAIAVSAVVLSLPAWFTWWWLARRR